jgi:hypothetical protein
MAQAAINACALAGPRQKLRKTVAAEVVATLGQEHVVALLGASQRAQRLAIIGS